MIEKRQGEKRLTYDTSYHNDTSYRAGDGGVMYSIRGNMSPSGSAAVRDFATAAQQAAGYPALRVLQAAMPIGAMAPAFRQTLPAAPDVEAERAKRRRLAQAQKRVACPLICHVRRLAGRRLGIARQPKEKPQRPSNKDSRSRVYIPYRKLSASRFPIALIFTALMCSLLFMYMIYNIVRINEYTIDIAKLKSRPSELTAQQNELTLKLEKKNDLVEIERIATQEYGMVKRDKVAKQYVNVGDGDVIEVETSDESDTVADARPR